MYGVRVVVVRVESINVTSLWIRMFLVIFIFVCDNVNGGVHIIYDDNDKTITGIPNTKYI